MLLTPNSVVHHLIERDLLDEHEALQRVTVDIASGRNLVFRVRLRDGGFFVKQAQRWQADELRAFEREALIHTLFEGPLSALRELVPALLDFHEQRRIMVFDLLRECDDLSCFYLSLPSEDLLRTMGATVGMMHRETFDAVLPPAEKPWCFSLDRQSQLSQHSGEPFHAQVHAAAQVPAFIDTLPALAERWRESALIHGDLKWANWLAHATPQGFDELFLVDWELAGSGDTAWDVASMFYAVLFPRMATGAAADDALRLASPAISAFVAGYLSETATGDADAIGFVERCAAFLGARCLQGAYELPPAPTRASIARHTLELGRACFAQQRSLAEQWVDRS